VLLGLTTTTYAHGAEESTHLVDYLGKLHPVVIHFPIALILAAAFSEILFMLIRKEGLRTAARLNLLLGMLGAAVAIAFGFAAAADVDYPADYAKALAIHRVLGIAALVLAAAALAVLRRLAPASQRMKTLIYRLLLLTAAGLVSAAGHYGGMLVHGLDYLMWQ